jgi:hypothetical protein
MKNIDNRTSVVVSIYLLLEVFIFSYSLLDHYFFNKSNSIFFVHIAGIVLFFLITSLLLIIILTIIYAKKIVTISIKKNFILLIFALFLPIIFSLYIVSQLY